MKNILTVNEFFGFGKPLPYDEVAKKTFKQLLNNLDNVQVRKFADDKREVVFTPKKEDNAKNETVSVPMPSDLDNGNPDKPVDKTVTKARRPKHFNQESGNYEKEVPTEPKKEPTTKIEVMKNYSKHRLSSKIFGNTKQGTFALAINGKHFVKDERGSEGKVLVSNNITEGYWNLLTDVHTAQEDLRRRLIDDKEYKSKLDAIRQKYSSWFSKLK